jgi:acyl-CoA thioesterase I
MNKISRFLILAIFLLGCSKKETAKENVVVSEEIVQNNDTVKYLALGDSYTIGQNVDANLRFPVLLIDSLRTDGINCQNPKIIATTGWTTSNLISAINAAVLPDTFNLVSLLIGVNNQYQNLSTSEYAIQFEQLLQIAIQKVGGDTTNVFVLSIPDYGVTPFGAANATEIALEIDQFNAINREITEQYGISYFNITEISRLAANDLSLIASDGLHPSGKMYQLWVDLIFDSIKNKVTD